MHPESESEAKVWAKIVSSMLSSVNSILEKLGASVPWIRHWLSRPVILPHQHRNWWHLGSVADRPAMQIASYWYITNVSDRPIRILNAYIKSPHTSGHVLVKDVASVYFGSYPIPPHTTTELHADFWILPPACKKGRDFYANIVFVDAFGQRRTLRKVRFQSNERSSTQPLKLPEEALYELAHDVEKKVAAVLKDEISRYKQAGRRSGELGSVFAQIGDRKIKNIYQDSWTSSRAGEQQEISTTPNHRRIVTENGDSLVELYGGLATEDERSIFVNSLAGRLNRNREYYCVSYLIVYVLFRVGHLATALDAARLGLEEKGGIWSWILGRRSESRPLEQHQRFGYSDLFGLLNGMLRYEHESFRDDQLDMIERYVDDTKEHSFQIGKKINSIRSYRVGKH